MMFLSWDSSLPPAGEVTTSDVELLALATSLAARVQGCRALDGRNDGRLGELHGISSFRLDSLKI